MHPSLWIASLWPGFAQAWLLGRWGGLFLAMLAGAALNVALLATLVWPQWPVPGLPAGANAAIVWLLVLGFWIVGFVQLRGDLRLLQANGPATEHAPQDEADFREAQHLYLKGHWIEAETLLTGMIGRQPRDVEARLLLASVQRWTRRWGEATRTLAALAEDSAAAAWRLEIESELKRINELEHQPQASARDAA